MDRPPRLPGTLGPLNPGVPQMTSAATSPAPPGYPGAANANAPVTIPQDGDPTRKRKNDLEFEIRKREKMGMDVAPLRAELASIYDTLNPSWRTQAGMRDVQIPQAPVMDLASIPLRHEELRDPSGNLDYTKIPVVKGNQVNTRTMLTQALDHMFKATPEDTAEDMASKIENRAVAANSVGAALKSPDEVLRTITSLTSMFGGATMPSQRLTEEEKAYIAQAFQVGPGRKFATIDDVPDKYIDFAIGYGIAGLIGGQGLAPFANAASAGLGQAQAQLDNQFQQDTANFEAQRNLNLALAKRLGEISNANFQQQGYNAKDTRDLLERVLTNDMTLDRTLKSQALSALTGFFQTGDSARWDEFRRATEPLFASMGITLPERIDVGSKEDLRVAQAEGRRMQTERVAQVIDFADQLNEKELTKLDKEIALLGDRGALLKSQASKALADAKFLDVRGKAAMITAMAQAEALKVSAQAKMVAAQNRGAAGGGNSVDPKLKAIISLNTSAVAQYWKEESAAAKEVDNLRKQVTDQELTVGALANTKMADGAKKSLASLQKAYTAAESKYNTAKANRERFQQSLDNARASLGGGK